MFNSSRLFYLFPGVRAESLPRLGDGQPVTHSFAEVRVLPSLVRPLVAQDVVVLGTSFAHLLQL